VVVVAYTPCSPELPSDLEDSERRLTGIAKVEVASSPYAGGELVDGRSGSSKVTLLLLPDGAVSVMVFLRSFFSFCVTFNVSSLGASIDIFVRPGNRTLDFFFAGFGMFISMVGAVVIISGAGISL
jgi:hypothetical protein